MKLYTYSVQDRIKKSGLEGPYWRVGSSREPNQMGKPPLPPSLYKGPKFGKTSHIFAIFFLFFLPFSLIYLFYPFIPTLSEYAPGPNTDS